MRCRPLAEGGGTALATGLGSYIRRLSTSDAQNYARQHARHDRAYHGRCNIVLKLRSCVCCEPAVYSLNLTVFLPLSTDQGQTQLHLAPHVPIAQPPGPNVPHEGCNVHRRNVTFVRSRYIRHGGSK